MPELNIPALTTIAEWLEAGAPHRGDLDGFNMTTFGERNDCGTVACIAGAATDFYRPKVFTDAIAPGESAMGRRIRIGDTAAEILGLDEDQANVLFAPCDYEEYDGSLEFCFFEDDEEEDHLTHADIDPAWAARTIRHLIGTGEVDWRVTAPRPVVHEDW